MPARTPELLQREFRVDRRTRPSPAPQEDPSRVPTDPDALGSAAEPEFSPTALTPPLPPARTQPPSPSQWALRPGSAAPPNLPRRVPPLPGTAPPGRAPPPASQPAPAFPALPGSPARSAPRAGPRPVRQELPEHLLVTLPGTPAASLLAPRPVAPLVVTPVPEPVPTRTAAPPAAVVAAPPPSAAPAAPGTVRATPASLGRRLAAWLVDLGLITSLCGLFLTVALLVIAPRGVGVAQSLALVALPAALLLLVLAFVYAALFAFLFQGRTPGRGLTGIRLVDEQGTAPGPARALARAALSLVSVGLCLSGFWLALFDRRGQTLHDKLTRTFVVRLLDA